jgi:hypothetical protein
MLMAGGTLTFCGFHPTDILTMRTFFFLGTACGTFGFHAMIYPRVPHAMVFSLLWGGVWLVINGARISWLLYERYPVALTDEEELAYAPFQEYLRPRIFKRLVDAGSWRTIDKGTVLKEECSPAEEMLLVLKGKVVLAIDGSRVATVRPGQFVGLPSLNGLLGPEDEVFSKLKRSRWPAMGDEVGPQIFAACHPLLTTTLLPACCSTAHVACHSLGKDAADTAAYHSGQGACGDGPPHPGARVGNVSREKLPT